MESGKEQNQSEEATPFKLARAREKGMVARGMDLGFLAGLTALAAFLFVAGERLVSKLAQLMRISISAGADRADDPEAVAALAGALFWPAIQPVLLLGGTVVLLVIFCDIVQLRGLVFTTQPLKPDFSRINPAKGLKRLMSLRMIKEALKNVLKLAAYGGAACLVIFWALGSAGQSQEDARGLTNALHSGGIRLLLTFILLACFFAAVDQIIVRLEFRKQMRMSRRELTREAKDREGEPRIRQKRKQLHAELTKQAKQAGSLPGSDLLVVNPQHFAVALAYDGSRMKAPSVCAKAKNHYALALKREAFLQGIPIFEDRRLARALYDECDTGREIGSGHYRAVAELYMKVAHAKSSRQTQNLDA
jgi:flagellar biosynthesis protein FlhB